MSSANILATTREWWDRTVQEEGWMTVLLANLLFQRNQHVFKSGTAYKKSVQTGDLTSLGQSYDDCFTPDPAAEQGKRKLSELETAGVLNRSAQHVDIVCDFREGGAGRSVAIDGQKLMVRDNLWVPA